MYNQYLKVVSLKDRHVVITEIDIPAKVPICEFTGAVYTDEQINSWKNQKDINNVLQVGPNLYIGPSGGIDDHIGHSCNPNCYIHATGKRAILYSLHLIKVGTEITFDYSSTSTDGPESWKMECKCGSFNCRKIISGFGHLSTELQKEYKDKRVAALFIREPIFLRK